MVADTSLAKAKKVLMQSELHQGQPKQVPPPGVRSSTFCSSAVAHQYISIPSSTHIYAFVDRSQHKITVVDSLYCADTNFELSTYDAIVLHYSVVLSDDTHIPDSLAERITAFNGVKMASIQDEYRWGDRQNAGIERLARSVVYTVTNREVPREICRIPYFDNVRFEHTLTGFIPEHLLTVSTPDYQDRSIDVS